MKNITKKIIAVAALLCVAMSSVVSCSNTNSGSSESAADSSSSEVVKQFKFEVGSAADDISTDDLEKDIDGEDATESDGDTSDTSKSSAKTTAADKKEEQTTQTVAVTDNKGQTVTEVATVTDDKGATVTDDKGQSVTTMVVKTEVVVNTKKADNSAAEANEDKTKTTTAFGGQDTTETENTENGSESGYKQKTDGRYAMWLDISKDENFYFEGPMIKATFKVKEGIPDGDYRFRISPDLSDIAGVAVKASKVIDGTIRVNKGSIDPVDVEDDTSPLLFYGDNIACKQGDTIDCYINIKNNTGLAAFCIWFYFDKNALEFVEAEPCGEFEEIANNVESGGSYKGED